MTNEQMTNDKWGKAKSQIPKPTSQTLKLGKCLTSHAAYGIMFTV